MFLRPGHAAQCVGESAAERKYRHQLNEVRERRWILKRMCTVRLEEAAAVGAEFLDELLRRHRALRNRLIRDGVHHWLAIRADHRLSVRTILRHLKWFDQLRRVIWPQVLNNALGNEQ